MKMMSCVFSFLLKYNKVRKKRAVLTCFNVTGVIQCVILKYLEPADYRKLISRWAAAGTAPSYTSAVYAK